MPRGAAIQDQFMRPSIVGDDVQVSVLPINTAAAPPEPLWMGVSHSTGWKRRFHCLRAVVRQSISSAGSFPAEAGAPSGDVKSEDHRPIHVCNSLALASTEIHRFLFTACAECATVITTKVMKVLDIPRSGKRGSRVWQRN